MLYTIAHILRDKLSWLWNIIEWINGLIFYMRYGKKLKAFSFTTVPDMPGGQVNDISIN